MTTRSPSERQQTLASMQSVPGRAGSAPDSQERGIRRDAHVSKRCEQIVQIASRRFARQGYAATSMRDIASDCGIKASSLYSHFSSKAEMLLLLLDPFTSNLRAAQARALAAESNGLARLQRMIREVLGVCLRYPSEMTILHYSWPQIREETELAPIVRQTAETFAGWQGVVEEGIEDGSIRPDVEPATVARIITGALQSVSDDRRYQDETSMLTARGFEALLQDIDAMVGTALRPGEGEAKDDEGRDEGAAP